METFHNIKRFLKENKMNYFKGILLLIICDIFQLVIPKVLGIITNLLESNNLNMSIVLKYTALIVVSAVVIAAGRFGWRMYIMGVSRNMEYWLRNKVFGHLEKLSPKFYNNTTTGDLMARATSDIMAVRMAFGPGVVSLVDAIVLIISVVFIMVTTISLKLTVIALIPLPIISIIINVFGKRVRERFKIVQEAFAELTSRVQENFSGIRIIKSFVQENNQLKIFRKSNQNNYNSNMKLVKLFGLMNPTVMFVASISYVLAIALGGKMVIEDTLMLGELVSFISYLGMLTWPMMAIGQVINMIQRGTASMKRLNEILDVEPEIKDINVDESMRTISGEIKVNDLTFTYPESERPSLKNINLHVKEGETLAVIGRTGSGKTTLINILLRMYNIDDNKISIGGKDLNRIPLKILRENIGSVPQENFLFSKSIRDNIALYNKSESMENVVNATKISQIHSEIEDLPQGFQTELGERGVNLSGGQRQRTSIARAVVKNPKILVLDDSLSAVDTNTEENILNGLKTIMKERTSIIISHRISTIKDADKIIVMDDGMILEEGNHEELLDKKGLYYEIFEKQQLEDSIRTAE